MGSKPKPYRESLRPQFHFTAKRNWLNDPNGMVYYRGEYHLFFQHNPKGVDWGNMTWGHAVSEDMIHWKQLPHALREDELGMIYSGSAVVDTNNTTGFQTGDEPPLVACFTYSRKAPSCQAIAYSNDGRTFHKYEGNPVIPNITAGDRDPKVFWHDKTKSWVMVLYIDQENTLSFFTSRDLKKWKRRSSCGKFHECPDLFELPVDDNPRRKRWVLHGASGAYLIGKFNGKVFTPDHERLIPLDHGRNFYAAQSFNNMPDRRRVQITWMQGGRFPGMPFNQQMGFPCELTLRSTPNGIRMFRWPVREIETLYEARKTLRNRVLKDAGPNLLSGIEGDLFDIEAEIKIGTAKEIGFTIRGRTYSYEVRKKAFDYWRKAVMPPEKGRIKVRILVDRASVELFGNDGLVSITDSVIFSPYNKTLEVYARGGRAILEKMVVRTLKSVWPV